MKIYKIIFQNCCLVLFGLTLCVVLLEVFLRLTGMAYYLIQGSNNKSDAGAYRVMCVGESTTAFGGQDSYPSQLEYALNQKYPDKVFNVINKGRPAQQSGDLLGHLEGDLNRYDPDVVIFMVGVNDAIKYKGRNVDEDFDQRDKIKLFIVDSFRVGRLANLVALHLGRKWQDIKDNKRLSHLPIEESQSVEKKFRPYETYDVNQGDDIMRLKKYHPKTVIRYNKMINRALDKGAVVIVMQYPTRDIDGLQSIVKRSAEVVFVENKKNFMRELKLRPWQDVFDDMFALNFGHCTRLGNAMIVENILTDLDEIL